MIVDAGALCSGTIGLFLLEYSPYPHATGYPAGMFPPPLTRLVTWQGCPRIWTRMGSRPRTSRGAPSWRGWATSSASARCASAGVAFRGGVCSY
eukprot:2264743-Pyramimonas_sp.AAC.1